jgi:Sulfotransferase family
MKSLFRLLPPTVRHHLRRVYVRRRHPKRFQYFAQLRTSVTPEGYSLISNDRLGCIFIHVPKCAGMSIAISLFGNLGGGHLRAEDYQIIYSPREFARRFKFTLVRNPWDRLASAYSFLKSGGMNAHDRAFADCHLSRYDSFEEFVMDWVNPQNVKLYHHFQPQVHFLCVNGRPPRLEFVGFFENLAADFAVICERLGVKAELGSMNKTNVERVDYQARYTERMIRIVADVYAQDIAMLGYNFDNSSLSHQLAARAT